LTKNLKPKVNLQLPPSALILPSIATSSGIPDHFPNCSVEA